MFKKKFTVNTNIFNLSEPLKRIELLTPSLPRKCSTPELQWLLSGRRVSNPLPTAWKAVALPNELLPPAQLSFEGKNRLPEPADRSLNLNFCGEGRIRTSEGITNRFTVCPIWPLWNLPLFVLNLPVNEPMDGFEPPTGWLQISCSGQLSYIGKNVKEHKKTDLCEKGLQK